MSQANRGDLRTIIPQLSLEGAAEAIAFFKQALGAEEVTRAVDPLGTKIWHAELRIGDSQLFVNDVFPEMGGTARTADVWLYGEDVDGRFARAVAAGATVQMPVADMFWGDRIGQVADRWGNHWCLAQHQKDLTPEELKQAEAAFVAQQRK